MIYDVKGKLFAKKMKKQKLRILRKKKFIEERQLGEAIYVQRETDDLLKLADFFMNPEFEWISTGNIEEGYEVVLLIIDFIYKKNHEVGIVKIDAVNSQESRLIPPNDLPFALGCVLTPHFFFLQEMKVRIENVGQELLNDLPKKNSSGMRRAYKYILQEHGQTIRKYCRQVTSEAGYIWIFDKSKKCKEYNKKTFARIFELSEMKIKYVRDCDGCGATMADWKGCAACKSRYYCGEECQKKDWESGHKNACAKLMKARKTKSCLIID